MAKDKGRRATPPSLSWRTFLANHVQQIAATDFFVIPTATCRLLFVLIILGHDRRPIVHVAVTAHPTAAWTAQQLRERLRWRRLAFGVSAMARDIVAAFRKMSTKVDQARSAAGLLTQSTDK